MPRYKHGGKFSSIISACCSVVCLIVILGWALGSDTIIRPPFNIIQFSSAVGLLFLSLGTHPSLNRFHLMNRVLASAAIILGIVGVAEFMFGTESGWLTWLPLYDELLRPMPPNTAVTLIAGGTALSIVTSSYRYFSAISLPLLTLCLAIMIALSGSAFCGYIAHVPVGYSWGDAAPMSMIEAIIVIHLVIAMSLQTWGRFESLKLGPKETWKTLSTYTAASVFILTVTGSLFGFFPFYRKLHSISTHEIKAITDDRARAVSDLFYEVSNSILYIEIVLEGYIHNISSNTAPVDFISGLRNDPLSTLSRLLTVEGVIQGVVRLDRSNQTLFSVGNEIPSQHWDSPAIQGRITFLSPVMIERKLFLLATYQLDDRFRDIFLISTAKLIRILTEAPDLDDPFASYLAEMPSDSRITKLIYFESDSAVLSDQTVELSSLHIPESLLSRTNSVLIDPDFSFKVPTITAYAPVRGTDYFVVSSRKVKDVYNPLSYQMLESFSISLILASLGALGIYMLVRPLVYNAEQLRELTQLRSEELRRSLSARESTLREIHHWVKNSLQVISSLLNIQSRIIHAPELKVVIDESQDRIRAIARLHDLLYSSPQAHDITFADYFRDLADKLLRYYDAQEVVVVNVEANYGLVTLKHSIPCGLILSEIISQSVKSAKRLGGRINIEVQFTRLNDELAQLEIREHGSVAQSTQNEPAAFRYLLIERLVKQLSGTLNVSNEENTVNYKINFPYNMVD